MDRLSYMFERQAELQKHMLDADLPADRPDLLSYYALGLVSELGEVLQADKRWKAELKTGGDNTTVNIIDVRYEIADCFLYLINIALAAGMTAEEMFCVYEIMQTKTSSRNGIEIKLFDHGFNKDACGEVPDGL